MPALALACRPIDKESVLLHVFFLQDFLRLILVRNPAVKRHRLEVVVHVVVHEELAIVLAGLTSSLLALMLRNDVTELAASTRLYNAHFEPLSLLRPDCRRRHKHVDVVELLLLAVFICLAGLLEQLRQIVVSG